MGNEALAPAELVAAEVDLLTNGTYRECSEAQHRLNVEAWAQLRRSNMKLADDTVIDYERLAANYERKARTLFPRLWHATSS